MNFISFIKTFLFFGLIPLTAGMSMNRETEQVIKDEIMKESVKSIQLTRQGWRLSYPVIDLNGEVKLELNFDDISTEIKNYHYKIIHCNSNWEPSQLSEQEFLEGNYQNHVDQYDYSFNTYFSYIHYTLSLPNENIGFKISGNYAIIVYEGFDEENIAFVRRFMVAEKLVNVNVSVTRPVLTEFRDNSQQVDLSIEYGSFRPDDPYNDLKPFILQNGRWDNAISGLKPVFDRNGSLVYDYQYENVFPGGSEFRWFDIKSLRYQSPYIKSVEFRDGHFEVNLFDEENKSVKPYFYSEDLNGKYFIEIQEKQENDTDADYVWVNFSFPCSPPYSNGDFYIFGGLTNWETEAGNRMNYDFESQSYRLKLLLKQGLYNYQLAFCEKGTKKADFQLSEGNHYETENDYLVLVYHSDNRSRYERLVGYQVVNSLKQNSR